MGFFEPACAMIGQREYDKNKNHQRFGLNDEMATIRLETRSGSSLGPKSSAVVASSIHAKKAPCREKKPC